MSAQFITHDEFDAGQDRLFMRLTAFLTTQNDLIKTQAREDRRAILEQIQAVTAQVDSLEQRVTSRIDTLEQSVSQQFRQVNERFDKLESRMSGLEASQTTLKAATEGYAHDTSKQLADSHASLMEQINQLKRPPEQP